MDTTTLGRTGLTVSVAGLGCGGHSRLGIAQGKDEQHAIGIVKTALDLGINFIDTARAYGTEEVVGKAISGMRDEVVLSTKTICARKDGYLSADDIVASLELSLKRLGTDCIDIFNLHGVTIDQYPYCRDELVPALQAQQALGKIRFLGITETFVQEPSHQMLREALPDDLFDVVMVGFNLLNPSARHTVFPETLSRGVATQIMFAVRRALSNDKALTELVEQLISNGDINAESIDRSRPLGFLEDHPDVQSRVQAAYRFCRHEPGATVTLTGTGSADHLRENVASILAPPLARDVLEALATLFGDVDSVSGN